ncbi:Phosphotransferase enzyme family protein [compost metagenome]
MDLRPGNILVHNHQVSGFIDFESARGGASEIDFTKMITYFSDRGPSLRNSYTTGYESIRQMVDVDLVYPFYKFYDAFMAISWCKRRGPDKHQDFLQQSITTLEQLVGS